MSILVVNCDDWLGYHVVSTLLEHDYKVEGTIQPVTDGYQDIEDLTMFFGRNSSFSITSTIKKEYRIGIIVGKFYGDIPQNVEKLIVINPDEEQHRSIKHSNCTTIRTSILFGEWMPMNEKGIFHKNEYIPFTSEKFKRESIYAADFTEALMQWLKITNLPSELTIYPNNDEKKKVTKIEKNRYIRENIPNKENLKNVIEHYYKFKKMYNNF
ncbi:hypothetical protein [Oceanobacillus rekensis]|uniref:hypothetical protein n=1 Tax=Oceanobacillus rekensis TaxID=937927 RepID=UPI000B4475ED|nr:hypothetical protein [Oceanobacillus rekensis]